jgi:uncharacterized membrane protein
MKPFSIKEVIRLSWQSFAAHAPLFLGTCMILLALDLAFGMATDRVGQQSVGGMVISIFSITVAVVVQLGLYRMWIDLVRGKEARIEQMFSEYEHSFRYFSATIVYALIVVIGCVLFIVPGIIFAIKYGYYGYAMVDRKLGIQESLKLSATITHGAKWDILALWLSMCVLIAVSAIPFGLGLLVTVPMAMIMNAIVYNRLLVKSEQALPNSEATPSSLTTDAPVPFVPLGE